MLSNSLGSITTILPLPITSDTAGIYTCTLQLKNGQTIWATHTVTLPPEDGRDGMVSQRLVCFLILSTVNYITKSWQTSCQPGGDNEP